MYPRITPIYINAATTTDADDVSSPSASASPIAPLGRSSSSGLTIIRNTSTTTSSTTSSTSSTPTIPNPIITTYDFDDPTPLTIPLQQPLQQSQSQTTTESNTATTTNSGGGGDDLQIDWNLMQSILAGVCAKVALNSGSPPGLKFAEKTLEYLQALYQELPLTAFLTVLDQLVEATAAAAAQQQPPPAGGALTQDALDALVRGLEPLGCGVPAGELAQAILLKVWPGEYAYMLQGGVSSASDNFGDASQYIRVFSLGAAKATVACADAHFFAGQLSQSESLVKFLCDLYGADPLGFWSVFDQLCARCLRACAQGGLAHPDGVAATFLACCAGPALAPRDATLSPPVAASVPPHPMLPYAYPPHYLRKTAFVAYMRSASKSPLVQQQAPQAQPLTASAEGAQSHSHSRSPSPSPMVLGGGGGGGGEGGRTYLCDPERFRRLRKEECGDIDAFYPYTWRAALLIFEEIERRLGESNKKCVCFDEKHKQNLRKKWEEDPKGFFSIIDQIFEKLVQTSWNAVRDEARYVQSLIAKFVPQTVVSKSIQAYITPPEVAAAMMEA